MAKSKNYDVLLQKINEQIKKQEEKLITLREEEKKLLKEKEESQVAALYNLMQENHISIIDLEQIITSPKIEANA